jgi:tetratricopeptide (TPR) repeat protein
MPAHFRSILILLPLALAACTTLQTAADKKETKLADAVVRAADHSTPAGKLYDAGKFADALKLSQQELAATRSAGNSAKQQKFAALCLVADTQTILAKYKDAEALYKEARALLDEKSDADQPLLAAVLLDISRLRYLTADWTNSITYAEKAFNIRKKNLPENHPDLAEAMSFYGFVLTGTPDEPRPATVTKSHSLMLEAWKIRTKISADSRDVAESYNDLGIFFLTNEVEDVDIFPEDLDDEERTLKCLNKALDIRIRLLGEDHADVGDTLMNRAYFNLQRERHDEAIRDTQKAIALFEKSLGKDHPNVAYAYNVLGQIRQHQGRMLEAVAHFEKAQKIYELTFGPNHFYIGTVLENLADLYSDLGDTAKVKVIQTRLKRIHGIQI